MTDKIDLPLILHMTLRDLWFRVGVLILALGLGLTSWTAYRSYRLERGLGAAWVVFDLAPWLSGTIRVVKPHIDHDWAVWVKSAGGYWSARFADALLLAENGSVTNYNGLISREGLRWEIIGRRWYWSLGTCALGLCLVAIPSARYWRRGKAGQCLRCGYCLTGLTSARCPECGSPVPVPGAGSESATSLT